MLALPTMTLTCLHVLFFSSVILYSPVSWFFLLCLFSSLWLFRSLYMLVLRRNDQFHHIYNRFFPWLGILPYHEWSCNSYIYLPFYSHHLSSIFPCCLILSTAILSSASCIFSSVSLAHSRHCSLLLLSLLTSPIPALCVASTLSLLFLGDKAS